jgi:hypothetical protein
LLALNKGGAAVPAQDQINPTIGAGAKAEVNRIALPPEGLRDEKFKLFPRDVPERSEAGLSVHQAATRQAQYERAKCGPAEEKQREIGMWRKAVGENETAFIAAGPGGKPPTHGCEREQAQNDAHPPREFEENLNGRFVSAAHAGDKKPTT